MGGCPICKYEQIQPYVLTLKKNLKKRKKNIGKSKASSKDQGCGLTKVDH